MVCVLMLVLALPLAASSSSAINRLVDMQQIAPNVRLEMRYASRNNFLKQAVYDKSRCLLRAPTAKRLARVQRALEKRQLGLKIFDCYRPLSVQRKMWRIFPNATYVANPRYGSRHNRGAAVDLTLVNRDGQALEMPSDFDDFSKKAHTRYAGASRQAKKHRRWLQTAMRDAGFRSLASEWWHFDDPNWKRYGLLDIRL
ncbi:M15 family metallopeptidase [Romeriopsis navalis]|nr:M15 family metallopeptidase [Romeriopsis navalis]